MKFSSIFDVKYKPIPHTAKQDTKMARKKEMSISDFDYHNVNPFLDGVVQQVAPAKTSKVAGWKFQDVLNINTGELEQQRMMVLATRREVDKREFAKIYYGQFKEFYGLSKSSLTLIDYIIKNIRYSNDRICLIVSDIIEQTDLSYTTVYRSLTQLLESKILAKAEKTGCYFINPQIFFKGDTITLINQYIKNDKRQTPIQNKRLKIENT